MTGDEKTNTQPEWGYLSGGPAPVFMQTGQVDLGDTHADPMEAMGNLFDVAILIGVGFMIVALSGFGLKELLSKEDVTIVKNPGTEQMEIITKENGQIKTLKRTEKQAEGMGQAIGTVYKLDDGRTVWIPDDGAAARRPRATEPDTGLLRKSELQSSRRPDSGYIPTALRALRPNGPTLRSLAPIGSAGKRAGLPPGKEIVERAAIRDPVRARRPVQTVPRPTYSSAPKHS